MHRISLSQLLVRSLITFGYCFALENPKMDNSDSAFTVSHEGRGSKLILPCGYRFAPRDTEIVVHYLKRKILGQQLLPFDIIPTIDVYSHGSPDQLPFSEFTYGEENVWYFFTTKPNGDLLTTDGYWRALSDGDIFNGVQVVGFMQTLAFYYAKPLQGMKTDWYIDEYRVNPEIFVAAELDDATKEKISNFVVCKVRREQDVL